MRFGVLSTMIGLPWAGSEELWGQAAHVLLAGGHAVCANVAGTNGPSEPLRALARVGAKVRRRPRTLVGRTIRRAAQRVGIGRYREMRWLRWSRPDLVLVSAGFYTDDPLVCTGCRALGIPYAIVVQAAAPDQAIDAESLMELRDAYRHAESVFFLSRQNRQIVEAMLDERLPHAEIFRNPFNVRPDATPPWPEPTESWRLACVARINFFTKGQDILIELMRRPKWRERPLEIVLWGQDCGSEREARSLVQQHGLENQVRFGGFTDDVEAIWADHHGFVLPTRFEGGPMVLVEAMLCGRMPIITDVGYAGEFVDDNVNGFLAPEATIDAVDDALERAWQRRNEWQAIGARAAATIRQRHSLQPARDFACRLVELAGGGERGSDRQRRDDDNQATARELRRRECA